VAYPKLVVFSLKMYIQEGKTTMFYGKIHEQTILEIPQGIISMRQPIHF